MICQTINLSQFHISKWNHCSQTWHQHIQKHFIALQYYLIKVPTFFNIIQQKGITYTKLDISIASRCLFEVHFIFPLNAQTNPLIHSSPTSRKWSQLMKIKLYINTYSNISLWDNIILSIYQIFFNIIQKKGIKYSPN